MSSVSRANQSIEDTNLIDKKNAPSRAKQIVQKEDILFGTTRPLLKKFTIVPNEYDNQICSTGFCVFRSKKGMILSKWIFYNITSNLFLSYVENHQKGTSYPAISDKEVKNFKIPIPSLEGQSQIVEKLNHFNDLVHDIEKGLPKEIELRQKQYEYYRDKLLDFN